MHTVAEHEYCTNRSDPLAVPLSTGNAALLQLNLALNPIAAKEK